MPTDLGIAIAGCGTVGAALAKMLLEGGHALTARTGLRFELRHVIVRDAAKSRGIFLSPGLVATDESKALADPQVKVFVELIGGADRARDLTLAALAAGKDVVTANKALLAHHGAELFAAARRAGRCIAFEAAVAGGVPLIESIRRGLIANEIDAVYGILNGTCNFILTRMLENQASYAHALAEAQRLGYAEADPRLDVDGIDSAHKLAVLASIATRRACALDKIPVIGISNVDLIDLTAAVELGYACKLLARAAA
jgi:homoserine dehydrogenase